MKKQDARYMTDASPALPRMAISFGKTMVIVAGVVGAVVASIPHAEAGLWALLIAVAATGVLVKEAPVWAYVILGCALAWASVAALVTHNSYPLYTITILFVSAIYYSCYYAWKKGHKK